jgi:4-phytase/acid phosphatase/peptide/nickel transport system substrate-binding protein
MDGDFQISGWRMMDLDDMGSYLNACLHTKGKLNFSRYQNPAMDELLMAQQTSTDKKTRQIALCSVARMINEDVMYFYGGGRRFHAIAKSDIMGIDRLDQGIIRVKDAWLTKITK